MVSEEPKRFVQSLRGGVALKKYHPQKTLPSFRTYRTRVSIASFLTDMLFMLFMEVAV